jgi:hypothetical protein
VSFAPLLELSFVLLFSVFSATAQTPFLERTVNITASNISVKAVLSEVEKQAGFNFSYNAEQIATDKTVTLSLRNESVRTALHHLFGSSVEAKQKGEHLVLKKTEKIAQQPNRKSKYVVSGYIIDSRNGNRMSNVSIYDNSRSYAAVSDDFGYYSLTLPSEKNIAGLTYSRKSYLDTIIIIKPVDDMRINIFLREEIRNLEKINPITETVENKVEETGLVKIMVPGTQAIHAENIIQLEQRKVQVSLLPMIGSNAFMSGVIENKVSVNVFGGYSGGVNGLEIGGFFNIVRKDVRGVQLAGFANITGGKTNGTQLAGFFNNNRGSMYGVQAAGFNNFVMDTMKGVQAAGFNNIVVGRLDGLQAAGFNNIATNNSDGIQIAGFSNIALKDLNKAQLAGFMNYAGNARGIQLAGFGNIARNEMSGTQLSGFFNYGTVVKGVQLSAAINVDVEEMTGTQIAGIMNIGGKIKGTQIGFLNFADSVSGATIGFFSFVRKGYHEVEVTANETFFLNASFKTGTHLFYTIFTSSFFPSSKKNGWSIGYGIGSDFKAGKKLRINLDLTGSQINEGTAWTPHLNMLNKARLNLGVQLFKGVYFVVGPEFNVQVSRLMDTENNRMGKVYAPYTFYDSETRGTNVQMWIGGNIGFRL